MTRRPDDRGQAAIFVIGMAVVALAVTFFMIEATRAFLMRRTLQNAADAAAIAGASQLDQGVLYASGGTQAILDPARAEAAAAESIETRGVGAEATIDAGRTEVDVRLRKEVETPFLRFVGIDAVPVDAEAIAEPIAGPPSSQ